MDPSFALCLDEFAHHTVLYCFGNAVRPFLPHTIKRVEAKRESVAEELENEAKIYTVSKDLHLITKPSV
jgi:hypothetical protein